MRATPHALRATYSGLITSALDYGCVVYGSAASITFKKLDNIENQALRLCAGAFKTSPTAARYHKPCWEKVSVTAHEIADK